MQQLLELDGNILLFIQNYIRQDWMDEFWIAVTKLADAGWFWIALSIVLLCFEKTRKIGVASLLALGIGALITNVALKNLVARVRPYEVIDSLQLIIDPQNDFSFPSGHSCASFASAMVIYKLSQKKYGISAVILAVLIALSRLYVGVHYPSDVLGGIVIGIFSAWLSVKVLDYIEQKRVK